MSGATSGAQEYQSWGCTLVPGPAFAGLACHSHIPDIWCVLRCRLSNVFIIGKDDKPLISLPKGKGVRLDILQEQAKREAQRA